MTFFLVFLAVALIGAVLWAGAGGRSGRSGGRALPALLDAGLDQPPANLPPVLLPANAAPQDVDRVRFSLGLRGYRMDQVDQVLDELRDQLAASRDEVEVLKARLEAMEDAGSTAVPAAEPAAGTGAQAEPPAAETLGHAEAGAGAGAGEDRE
ncbi:DivIVA domain-containing protein [Pseudarthrobacter oxydans]|uniref:DivIVA domain-containing protein n=1 Tax=Pseudarthrobacter oxydans TaxID=1671 RepID=UPI003D2B955C